MTTASPQRIGGLTRAIKAGPGGMRAMASKGGTAAFNVYGDSPEARSLRAIDLAAKRRGMTERQWCGLMRRRARSFDVPIERLIPRLRTTK